MSDALDTTNEISKLLKYSPKRHTLLEKLKKQLAPDVCMMASFCGSRLAAKDVDNV